MEPAHLLVHTALEDYLVDWKKEIVNFWQLILLEVYTGKVGNLQNNLNKLHAFITLRRWHFNPDNPTAHAAWNALYHHLDQKVTNSRSWDPFVIAGIQKFWASIVCIIPLHILVHFRTFPKCCTRQFHV